MFYSSFQLLPGYLDLMSSNQNTRIFKPIDGHLQAEVR